MAKKSASSKSGKKSTGKKGTKATRPSTVKTVAVAAPLPKGAKGNTPFVLLFAEQKAVDVLKEANCVFSELIDGLTVQGSGDQACSTFGGSSAGDGYDSAGYLA